MVDRERIAIIGAGHVGATAAYALMLRALFGEIVLIDNDRALAEAEAADLSDANALARPARIWAGSYADAASARIVVVTAGAATHGSDSRLSVVKRSGAIVTECALRLAKVGFAGILVIAANPVDLMALVAFRHATLPAQRVIGTGTLLDTNRLRQALAVRLGVASGSIGGFVLGEHGDSEVAAFSTVSIGGQTLEQFASAGAAPEHAAIAIAVRDAGYRIIAGKGYTSFGVATAIVRICEAILRDEHAALPVSTLMTGQLGIDGLYMSLPCILGAAGVERVLLPELTEEEQIGLKSSAEALRASLAGLNEMPLPRETMPTGHIGR